MLLMLLFEIVVSCHHSAYDSSATTRFNPAWTAPFWAICQCITAGHVVGKLPYVGLLPQRQLGEAASCVI